MTALGGGAGLSHMSGHAREERERIYSIYK